MPHLELAAFTLDSAILALSLSNNKKAPTPSRQISRIELCASPEVGGTTPSLSDFTSLQTQTQNAENAPIPINIMLRPRGGSFTYTPSEIAQMEQSMDSFISAGASGFVFGILKHSVENTGELEIDSNQCAELVKRAKGRRCTFHRAFDLLPCEKMEEELEVLIRCGFTSVLTAGCVAGGAVAGKEMLTRLVERSKGRIEVIVGGGVRGSNLEILKRETGAEWWHSSADTKGSGEADVDEIDRMLAILEG